MEIFTYFLSAFLALLGSAGIFVDGIAKNTIRSQLHRAEQLQVRVDNVPSYQLIQGKVERVRIAGRGLWLTPETRIAALELETDPLNVDIQRLRQRNQRSLTEALRQPLQTGVRLVLTEDDLNKALQSPQVIAQLEKMIIPYLRSFMGESSQGYKIVNPRIDFLENNRLRLQVQLQQKGGTATDQSDSNQLAITVESGVGLASARQLQLISPSVTINDNTIPSFLLDPLAQNLSKQFDLAQLEQSGIIARLLQLKINPEQMEIAAFVRINPSTLPQTEKK